MSHFPPIIFTVKIAFNGHLWCEGEKWPHKTSECSFKICPSRLSAPVHNDLYITVTGT